MKGFVVADGRVSWQRAFPLSGQASGPEVHPRPYERSLGSPVAGLDLATTANPVDGSVVLVSDRPRSLDLSYEFKFLF
jgi:hypothetical protein